jgi:hypothetical protein
MNSVKHRYSAEIQRTRGLLELAAALYDTSLSFQTERAAEQAIQTESRVGYSLTLALTATREKGVSFSFAADGFRELLAVSRNKLSLGWINPSVAATMAFRGKGLFSKRQPIRTIAVFPSVRRHGICRARVYRDHFVGPDQEGAHPAASLDRNHF